MSEMSFMGGVITVNYLVVAVNVFLGANASILFFFFFFPHTHTLYFIFTRDK